ncbi:MAG: 50S ribosomal protein L19 [Candidatus Nealsonbacteria bacterium]|nr:50S ribosomal protein L19 [Candidatus Nealsonbacteria bacterium]
MSKAKESTKSYIKDDLPELRPGDQIRVFQKIKEKGKERVQPFEGTIIARKHNKELGATITVRRMIKGIGVEKIIPLNAPTVEKIEVIRRSKVRRSKLYYLRKARGKRARLKRRTAKTTEETPDPKQEIKKAEEQPKKEAPATEKGKEKTEKEE